MKNQFYLIFSLHIFADSEDMSFAQGLRSIPGIDDNNLDESFGDDLESTPGSRLEVPDIDHETSESEQDITLTGVGDVTSEDMAEDIKFVDKHFKDSSESDGDDESKMAQGLVLPDYCDVDGSEPSMLTSEGLLGQVTQQMTAAIATQVVANTMTSFMSSTMSGLTKMGQSVRAATVGGADTSEVQYHPSGERVQLSTQKSQSSDLAESTDTADLLEEFEFLEQEDLLENVDEDIGLAPQSSKPASD